MPDRSAFEFAQVACSPAIEYPQVETIHFGHGQPQHPLVPVVNRRLRSIDRQRGLGPLHRALRAQACQTANQAEIEISVQSRQCLGTRRIPDLKTLWRGSRAWNGHMNCERLKIDWKFNRRARRKFG